VRCYDCGHDIHGSEQCELCDCPDWQATQRLDAKLRERPRKPLELM